MNITNGEEHAVYEKNEIFWLETTNDANCSAKSLWAASHLTSVTFIYSFIQRDEDLVVTMLNKYFG